jgi:hypothetical protein
MHIQLGYTTLVRIRIISTNLHEFHIKTQAVVGHKDAIAGKVKETLNVLLRMVWMPSV